MTTQQQAQGGQIRTPETPCAGARADVRRLAVLLTAMVLTGALAVAILLAGTAARLDAQARATARAEAEALAEDIGRAGTVESLDLATVGARHGLADLRLVPRPPAGEAAAGTTDFLEIASPGDSAPLVLAWTVARPGGALLADLAPPLLAVLAILLGLGGAVLRRSLRDAAVRLADSEDRLTAAAADSAALRGLLMDAVNSIHEGFVLFDADGRLVVCNDRYREIYPTVGDLLVPGTRFSDILTAAAERLGIADETALRHWIESRLNRHLEHDGAVEARLSDGRWYRISERPTHTGGIVKVLMDITDTKAHAQALATKSEVLETTFEALAQGVCVFDSRLTLAAWNHRFAELGEYPAWLLAAGTPLDAFTTVDAGRNVIALPATREEAATPTNGTARDIALPSGRILEVRHNPLPRGGFVATFTDATAHQQAETALRHSQKMDAIGQLAGGIAHEFNNMLTSMGGFARMAQRTPDNAARVTLCLGEIVKAADRAAQLTAQLLDFSRRTDRDSRVPVHLKTLARDLTNFLRPLLGEHVDVEIAVHDSDLVVLADQAKLTQAIVNLCINARDAMPAGGTITIDVAPAEADAGLLSRHPGVTAQSFARLRVADGGTGIPAEILPRIFEPFFTTKEQGKGTGLGLPMVYSTVEQLGGAVEVETTPGKGSVFSLYLPRVVHAGPALEPGEAPAVVDGAGVTVLVAEDEDSVRELVAMTLRDAGFNVIAAADGAEAAVLYERHGEDCAALITDVVMPKLDGPALARRLLERDSQIKIVLMSGYDTNDEAATLARAPGRRFLRKPVAPDALLATLRHLLKEDDTIHEEEFAP